MEQTPQEYARELVNEMYMVDDPMGNYPMCFDNAKQCAKIAIKKIIQALRSDLPEVGKGKGYYQDALKEVDNL
jgi:hypothetical protein